MELCTLNFMISKAVELAFPSDAERCFFTLRSSLFTYLTITSIAAGRFLVIPSGPTALICEI